jgi:glycosyltransferase involved in cell wall biosynthesis
MKVLVFIDWFLPGDKAGGPVRSCANLIDHLNSEIEFYVVTRDTDYTSDIPYPNIQSNSWIIHASGAKVYYISNDKLNKDTILGLLKDTPFDHVYLNGMWSQPFTVWPLELIQSLDRKIPVTLAVRGMLAPSALKIKGWKKRAFLVYAKWKSLYSKVTFHATNEKEAGEVRTVFGAGALVKIAANLPRSQTKHQSDAGRASKNPDCLSVVSVARIAPEKNTLGAIRMLRGVKCTTEVNFWGTVYDEKYFAACKEEVRTLPNNVKVKFCGPAAAESVESILRKSDVLLLPTQGENFGHIILESLQCGTPVLISDQTPWRNLASHLAGWDLPLSNEPSFTHQLNTLGAMHDSDFQKWVSGATKLAESYVEDSHILKANRNLFLA